MGVKIAVRPVGLSVHPRGTTRIPLWTLHVGEAEMSDTAQGRCPQGSRNLVVVTRQKHPERAIGRLPWGVGWPWSRTLKINAFKLGRRKSSLLEAGGGLEVLPGCRGNVAYEQSVEDRLEWNFSGDSFALSPSWLKSQQVQLPHHGGSTLPNRKRLESLSWAGHSALRPKMAGCGLGITFSEFCSASSWVYMSY